MPTITTSQVDKRAVPADDTSLSIESEWSLWSTKAPLAPHVLVHGEVSTGNRTALKFSSLLEKRWRKASPDGENQGPVAVVDGAKPLTIAHFVSFADLTAHGTLPRRGSDANFVHNLTSHGNANLARPASSFDSSCTVFVFVSHRWARPGDSASGHPDDADNSNASGSQA